MLPLSCLLPLMASLCVLWILYTPEESDIFSVCSSMYFNTPSGFYEVTDCCGLTKSDGIVLEFETESAIKYWVFLFIYFGLLFQREIRV